MNQQRGPYTYRIMEQRGEENRAYHRKVHEFVCYDDHAASDGLKRWGFQELLNSACDSDGTTKSMDGLISILIGDQEVCAFFWGKSKYYYERVRS